MLNRNNFFLYLHFLFLEQTLPSSFSKYVFAYTLAIISIFLSKNFNFLCKKLNFLKLELFFLWTAFSFCKKITFGENWSEGIRQIWKIKIENLKSPLKFLKSPLKWKAPSIASKKFSTLRSKTQKPPQIEGGRIQCVLTVHYYWIDLLHHLNGGGWLLLHYRCVVCMGSAANQFYSFYVWLLLAYFVD